MPKTIIVEISNSAREIFKKMPTPHRNRWFQPLSDNEDSVEVLVDDEQKNERRKNHKERNDEHWWVIFCQNCHNEGHLTKECKLRHTICSIYRRQGHEVNDCPIKELKGQYVKRTSQSM